MCKYWQTLILNKSAGCCFLVFLVCFLATGTCSGQMFGASTGLNNQAIVEENPLATEVSANRSGFSSQTGATSTAPASIVVRPITTATGAAQSATGRATAPGVARLNSTEDDTEKEEPKIMLYMRDFKVASNLNGRPSCTMRFYITSSIPEKITNISYRLKWPNMETALSFDDVAPNMPTYFDYALLGKGCYSMDKAPNIIVNRCRIKNMSQRQCADAIQWVE